jgi:Protein of unknown function (DUF3455)
MLARCKWIGITYEVRTIMVIAKILRMAVLMGIAAPAWGQGISQPDVPISIRVPVDQEAVLTAHATGSQVYVCQTGKDGKAIWTFRAPEATLQDTHGATIGRHYAGPTWRDNDGSEVTGTVSAQVSSSDPHSIPWLLVIVTHRSGNGALSRVSTVQRVHTEGGAAPVTGCSDSELGIEAKVPYTADYYFYAPATR